MQLWTRLGCHVFFLTHGVCCCKIFNSAGLGRQRITQAQPMHDHGLTQTAGHTGLDAVLGRRLQIGQSGETESASNRECVVGVVVGRHTQT